MVSATSGGVVATYAFNALGQRVRKTVGGVSTYFVYDEGGHLLGEYDHSGNLIQETIWLEDIPIAVLKPNGAGGVHIFYIHSDHLNTPRSISRPLDNVIVRRWDSEPFGSTAAVTDPDGDAVQFDYRLRFPGQYYDSETGLHQNYFRDYDPATGRYMQSDPIGLRGRLNIYSYAYDNPVVYTDKWGLDPKNPPICSGPDCVSPPYDPTPNGPRPGPQPRTPPPAKSPPDAPRYEICGKPPLRSFCKTCVDWACSYAPLYCCDIDLKSCMAEKDGDPVGQAECNGKFASCAFRGGK